MADDEQRPLLAEGGRTFYDNQTIDSVRCDRPIWKTKLSFILVLIAETAERFAFYGLLCNMPLFLNSDPLYWASYNAINVVLIFNGISYFMTLIGGWLADSCLGKYRTVIFFFILYIAGFCIWPNLHDPKINSSCSKKTEAPAWCASVLHNFSYDNSSFIDLSTDRVPLHKEQCSWAVFLSLTIIAIGYGGVRVNIVPFGAQQIEDQGSHSLRVYFNWLYWCINVGSFLAYLILGYIQQDVSYFYGYIIPLCFLIIAWIIFASGTCIYVRKKEAGSSPLTNVVKVLISSVKYSCKRPCISPINENITPSEDETLETSADLTSPHQLSPPSISCLDQACLSNGGDCPDQNVHDTKIFFRIFFIFLSMIPYWTIYYQMQTTFFIQGLHMRLEFNLTNITIHDYDDITFKLPATWLSLFNIAFIIVLVPLLDRVIYPLLDSKQCSLTLRLRVIFGMFFAMVAMIVAGIIERIRLQIYWGPDNVGYPRTQIIACTTYYASDMSIFWQIPQYLLLALSEVFTSIAGLELAYIYAPRSIQSIIMGMFYWTQGIGAILGFVIIILIEGTWFPRYDYGNINCRASPFKLLADPHDHPDKIEDNCHLDYYFYTLAGIQVVGALLFCLVSWYLDVGGTAPLRVQNQGMVVVKPSLKKASDKGRGRRSRQDSDRMYYGT